MIECFLEDPGTCDRVLEVLLGPRPVVLLQLPAVQSLLAPATPAGIAALDETKHRLPGKTYGSAIGASHRFHALGCPGTLPAVLATASALDLLAGAFVRIRVAAPGIATGAMRDGTHQGLLLPDGPHRALFQAVEAAFASRGAPALFAGQAYTAPLCTSANLSGDPLGSIVDDARARDFGRARGLALWVRSRAPEAGRGSYPIVAVDGERMTLAREGPGGAAILARLAAASGRGAT